MSAEVRFHVHEHRFAMEFLDRPYADHAAASHDTIAQHPIHQIMHRRTDHRHAIERNTSEARSAAQSSGATQTPTPTKRPRPARWEHRVSSGPSALELDDKRWASHAMALHDVDADHR